jgi:hypothetical protein
MQDVTGGNSSLDIFGAFRVCDIQPISLDADASLSSIVSWQGEMEGARWTALFHGDTP